MNGKIQLEVKEILQRWRPGMAPDKMEMILVLDIGGAELRVPVGEEAVVKVMAAVHRGVSAPREVEDPTDAFRDDMDPAPGWQTEVTPATATPPAPNLDKLRASYTLPARPAPAQLDPIRIKPPVADDDPFNAG